MKKLMFAVVAMTAGVCLSDITSQNIVGYAQNALRGGATMVASQFNNVGTDKAMPLESFKPQGTGTENNVTIQTLDSAGRTVDNYMWVDYAGPDWDQIGWIDGNAPLEEYYPLVTGVKFPVGQGLWTYGMDGFAVQTAGEVGTDDVVVALRGGALGTGNPFPVAVNLTDIPALGTGAENNVTIQTLDSAGRTVDNYMWVDYAGPDWDQTGWIDGNAPLVEYYPLVTGVTFQPGQGLWVYGADGLSIQIPAPEL